MNPTHDQWSTSTSSPEWQAQQGQPSPERGRRVFDTVKVSPDTFESVMFMSCAERKEFTQDRRPNADKPQKRTADGVALWTVTLAAVNWRGKSELMTVTVPMHSNPGDKFVVGQPVDLIGLTFGVTAKRDGGGFVTWCSADAVEPANATAKVSAP